MRRLLMASGLALVVVLAWVVARRRFLRAGEAAEAELDRPDLERFAVLRSTVTAGLEPTRRMAA